MEYIYAAMLLHKAGQKINEANVKKVLEAASVKADENRVKALVAALEGVNLDEAMQKAQSVQPASPPTAPEKPEKKKVEPKEDEKSEEQAAAGLGALFG